MESLAFDGWYVADFFNLGPLHLPDVATLRRYPTA